MSAQNPLDLDATFDEFRAAIDNSVLKPSFMDDKLIEACFYSGQLCGIHAVIQAWHDGGDVDDVIQKLAVQVADRAVAAGMRGYKIGDQACDHPESGTTE